MVLEDAQTRQQVPDELFNQRTCQAHLPNHISRQPEETKTQYTYPGERISSLLGVQNSESVFRGDPMVPHPQNYTTTRVRVPGNGSRSAEEGVPDDTITHLYDALPWSSSPDLNVAPVSIFTYGWAPGKKKIRGREKDRRPSAVHMPIRHPSWRSTESKEPTTVIGSNKSSKSWGTRKIRPEAGQGACFNIPHPAGFALRQLQGISPIVLNWMSKLAEGAPNSVNPLGFETLNKRRRHA
ncbi:uncharacterized protein FOBCDRAFT_259486 [Fusarium oxysporum Fo47]|uniref:uncharacterized protein n=1 Tax=Fusarium oxysporum Fo47 TaxID=660027 RepID=UPI002869B1A7|nr:uncharacterized protein FOBCDRAFT_259486 [Fusarium oxysporum Fo47]QKD52677.2 hypothetical protein FOBCDRAFT_259486 [Fusarium oxysporum Fo47]